MGRPLALGKKTMPLAAGTRLGPYEVLAIIGAGGMGEVYRARDTRLDRTVAVKVLPSELSADPTRRRRFEREARAIAALSHPNICRLYDIGTGELGTSTGPAVLYLVMEYLTGVTLAGRLRRGPLPLAQALAVASQVASALDAAHRCGIIHCDLKPANVMLTSDDCGRPGGISAKLLDFGIARLVSSEHPDAPTASLETVDGVRCGTAGYMSPEQVGGFPVDSRSDVFSFGVLLYEMVSGTRDFEAGATSEGGGADVPAGVQRIVRRCVEKRPDDRYRAGQDLLAALDTWAQAEAPGPVPASKAETRKVVAVALFENLTGDPTLDLVGLMAADWVTDGLIQIPAADVALPPSSALGAGAASSPEARSAYLDPRNVAEATGASVVVSGGYYLEGEALVFRARLSEPNNPRVLAAIEPVRGARGHLAGVMEDLRRTVVGAVAFHLDTNFEFRGQRPPSLEAYREHARALTFWYRDWDLVIRHLERALELDPQFSDARVRLGFARFFCGDFERAQQAVDELSESGARLTEYERQSVRTLRAFLAGQAWEYLAAAREQMRLAPGVRDGGATYDAACMLYALNHPVESEQLLASLVEAGSRFGWPVHEIRCQVLHVVGRFKDQLAVAGHARARYPTVLYFHEHEAAALAAMGDVAGLERVIGEALMVEAGSGTPGLVMLVAAMELRAHGNGIASVGMAARAAEWYAAQNPERFLAFQSPSRGVEWHRCKPPIIGRRLREEHALALEWAGRWDEVREIVVQLGDEDPTSVDYRGWLGTLSARRGDADGARRVAEHLRTQRRAHVLGYDLYWRASIAAQLGERELAVALLAQAFSEGYWFQTQFHRTVDLEPLWDYPPFLEMLRPKG